jgi:hypothetical protein
MSATVKQQQQQNGLEEYHVAPWVRPEKGHLAPEVKMANGIVWDKLYPPFL